MLILQIKQKVPNYDGWKKAFESDPINRKKSGVCSYKIFRPVDDLNYVVLHLEFDSLKEAEDTLAALRNLWGKVEGKIMINPQTRILSLAEATEI